MGLRNHRTLIKYLLLQIPSWVLLVSILYAVRSALNMSLWVAGALVGLWIVKDLALYPLLRRAYENDPRTGGERLVGYRGLTVTPLAPQGYIRVRGELWRAELRSSTAVIPKGTAVKIFAAEGLTLAVDQD